MASTEITWPTETDLRIAEHPDYVRLSRVLVGLRRLSGSSRQAGRADMRLDTQHLVAALEATQSRIFVLVAQLRDGTATAVEQHKVADMIEDGLLDQLRSHADDTDAGIIPAPRDLERGCA